MKINELANSIVEKTDPKAMYDRMNSCQQEARKILSLARCYGRWLRVSDHAYSWDVREQMWRIETPKFSNLIPNLVAEEDIAYLLYQGNEWRWAY